MDMVAEAKKREGWRADGSSIAVNGEFIAEACYRQDAPFIANAPAFIVLQSKAIEALQQDKHDLQTLVKIVELGYDDLTESLAELANMILEYTTLPPRLLEKAREAKELVEA